MIRKSFSIYETPTRHRCCPRREKHLVGLAVTMTRGCQVCTRGRIEKARNAGIGDDVLNALVGVVSAVNAGVSAATAREGFRMADEALQAACGELCSTGLGNGRVMKPLACRYAACV